MLTPKEFVNGELLTDVDDDYYTVPDKTRAVISKATFTNDHSTTVTVTMHFVPSGGSSSAANQIGKETAILAGKTWSNPDAEGHILEPGGKIYLVASTASKIGAFIGGYEVT